MNEEEVQQTNNQIASEVKKNVMSPHTQFNFWYLATTNLVGATSLA